MSRDYTKEVGLPSSTVIVPWKFAFPILAVMAAAAWVGFGAAVSAHRATRNAPKTVTSVQIFIRE